MLFVLGVAFTFAPLMLMTVTTTKPLGPGTIAVWFAISGSCAVLWALAGASNKLLFLLAVPAQVLAALAIRSDWLGSFALGASSADRLGIASAICIGAGYTCFVIFILVHGKRAMTLSVEMSLAAKIHRHLVPAIDLTSENFEVAARSDASGVMGGDVVHAALLADGSIEALVADVSGHGVRAGVVMAMVKATIESHRTRRTVGEGRAMITELAQELNRVLLALTEADMFVTAALVHVTPDGVFHALVAGHPPIIHRLGHASGTVAKLQLVGGAGLPLGVIEDLDASISTGVLEKSEELVLYSDGLTEARVVPRARVDQSSRERSGLRARGLAPSLLGVDGLAAIIATMPSTPSDAVAGVLDSVIQASVSQIPEDDQTVMVLRRRDHSM